MTESIDFKVVILGRSDVGKTCLIMRYISGDYNVGPNVNAYISFLISL